MKKHCENSSSSSTSSEHELTKNIQDLNVTFQVLDSALGALPSFFTVQVKIIVQGPIVQLHIPALNFTIPGPHENPIFGPIPGGGLLITSSGFLPQELRPTNSVFQSFTLQADQTNTPPGGYDGYIARDGSIWIVAPGDQLIPEGPQVTHAKTVTYTLQFKKLRAPKNFALSHGRSQMNQPDNPDLSDQFLDFYRPSFVNGVAAFCWSDNADTKTTPPYSLNVMTRVARLVEKHDKTKLKLEEPVLAFQAPLGVYCAENSITIDPTNTQNMFFTSNLIDLRQVVGTGSALIGVSVDAGKHWVTRNLVVPLPNNQVARGDLVALYDRFGNLWVCFLASDTATSFNSIQIVILFSNDKGLSFQIAFVSSDGSGSLGYDFPQISFGGDGQGSWAFWWVVRFGDRNNPFVDNPRLGYIPVSNIGVPNFAGVNQVALPAVGILNPLNLGIADTGLVATDDGVVYIMGASESIGAATTNGIQFEYFPMYVNPKGINFTANDIVGPQLVAQTNMGLVAASLGAQIPFQNVRGCRPPFSGVLQVDNKKGLLYALINDFDPWNSVNMTIYLIYSENGGQSWSEGIPISDDNCGNRSLVGMWIDPTTGNLIFNWYDARGDPSNNTVRFFATILLAEEIDKIRGSKEKCPKPTFKKSTLKSLVVGDIKINPIKQIRSSRISKVKRP